MNEFKWEVKKLPRSKTYSCSYFRLLDISAMGKTPEDFNIPWVYTTDLTRGVKQPYNEDPNYLIIGNLHVHL